MRPSVVGHGYVGAVSAACFASDGHAAIGVDIHTESGAEPVGRLMRPTLNQVSQQSDIVIIGNEADKFRALEYLISGDQRVIDLARLFPISKSNGS